MMLLRAAPCCAGPRQARTRRLRVRAASEEAPAAPLRRRQALSLAAAALAAAAAPPLRAEEGALVPFAAACGATLLLPQGWVKASDRANAGQGALTLALWGDFSGEVDTVSLRREPLPDGAEQWLASGATPADDVAQRLTAPERAAVVAGTATGAVAGVPSAESGVLSFDVLSASQRDRYYTVETRSEACRGNIQEASKGALLCLGPRGDELPTITRHALSVHLARPPFMYVLKASVAESRWAQLAPTLRAVAASFDGSGIHHPDEA